MENLSNEITSRRKDLGKTEAQKTSSKQPNINLKNLAGEFKGKIQGPEKEERKIRAELPPLPLKSRAKPSPKLLEVPPILENLPEIQPLPREEYFNLPDPIDQLNAPEIKLQKQTDNEGKKISDSFKFNDLDFGREEIDRIDTVPDIIKISEIKIKYYNSLVQSLTTEKTKILEANKLKNINEQIDLYKSRINFAEKNIENAKSRLNDSENTRNTWLDSNTFRKLLGIIIGSFKRKAEFMPSGAVNLRVHSYTDAKKHRKAFLRGAVICDWRNGWTNLAEMKEMVRDPAKAEAKKTEIITQKNKLKKYEQIESANHALEELTQENLSLSLESRRQFLEDQMLQLISTHVSENQSAVTDNWNTLDLVHLALLNPKKYEIDKNGWAHIEENQIRDMAEIFKEFDGRKVIFDGKGPYIDKEGNIHSDKKPSDGYPNELILNTIFINISVQGTVENTEAQREINEPGFNKLKKLIETRGPLVQPETHTLFKKVLDAIDHGESNFWVAEEFSDVMLQLNLATGIHCASGKDRTGFVSARVVQRLLARTINNNANLTAKQKTKLKNKFAHEILNFNKPAALVVKDNTNIIILKISPFTLPGFEGGILNPLRRIKYLSLQTFVIINI